MSLVQSRVLALWVLGRIFDDSLLHSLLTTPRAYLMYKKLADDHYSYQNK